MLIEISYYLRLRRKVMRLRSLGDTRFQGALNCVASQVKSSLIALSIEKHFSFLDSNFRQFVEVSAIHLNSSRVKRLVSQALHRRRNPAAAPNELIGRKATDRHDWRRAQQATEFNHVANLATGN